MGEVTTYPVIGPAPNAGFFASYTREHLRKQATANIDGAMAGASTLIGMAGAASSQETRGYLHELGSYLSAAAVGPRRGVGQRTSLYGLQVPPLDGRLTAIRCTELTTLDEVLPFLLPFAMTNAAPQVRTARLQGGVRAGVPRNPERTRARSQA